MVLILISRWWKLTWQDWSEYRCRWETTGRPVTWKLRDFIHIWYLYGTIWYPLTELNGEIQAKVEEEEHRTWIACNTLWNLSQTCNLQKPSQALLLFKNILDEFKSKTSSLMVCTMYFQSDLLVGCSEKVDSIARNSEQWNFPPFKVWPIDCHFRILINTSTGNCLVWRACSSFGIRSDQSTRIIRQIPVLKNAWSLAITMAAIFHMMLAYDSIERSLAQNNLNLILVWSHLYLHILDKTMKADLTL